jgi:pimeloyl-ACP methyl ester carboxylesterase
MPIIPKIKVVESKALGNIIEGFDSGRQNRLVIEREVLPIVFVPGIMGSRLQNQKGDRVWDPDDAKFMLRNFGLIWAATAKSRMSLIVGSEYKQEYLAVLNADIKHNAKFANEIDATRDTRGWGGVSWNSYGDILKALQEREWDQSVNLFYEFPVHAFGYNWTGSNGLAGMQLAAYIDQVINGYSGTGRKCAKVLLVTHSMGGLVARSACLLHGAKDKVLGVIHGVQPANGSPAAYWRMKGGFERPHTIPDLDLVQWLRNPVKMFNHQMGKLVNNEFLGLGHVSAWVLGTDGEEVTALLGNMPGGLELLPNKQYKNNNGWERWLELLDKNGDEITLPIADPYKEIYRQDEKYFRLVNPAWLNPGALSNSGKKYRTKTSWDSYLECLSVAESFHDALAKLGNENAHPETYQFYSSGIASPDRVVFTQADDSLWEKVKRFFDSIKNDLPSDLKSVGKSLVFKTIRGGGNPLIPVLIDTAETLAVGVLGAVTKDTDWYANRGGYRDRVGSDDKSAQKGELQLVTMQLPDGAGDGTVPESSARALKLPEDKQRTFCIADLLELEAAFVDKKAKRLKPKCKVDFDEGYFDRGHEPIFRTKSAHFITITAIENICRNEIRRVLQKG